MICILGTKVSSRLIYDFLSAEDKKLVSLVSFSGLNQAKTGSSDSDLSAYPVISMEEAVQKGIEHIFIPTHGINLVKRARGILKETYALDDDICTVVSPKAFALTLNECGSVNGVLDRCRDHILYINSIEFEVAQHCNLNCKGCNHFSPLSEKRFGDLSGFERDLRRLHDYVDHIGEIRLVGGEPLLNPQLDQFVRAAHEIYPYESLTVITNGILLSSVSPDLIEAMKDTGAYFSLTLYPPVKDFALKMAEAIKEQGIRVETFSEVTQFSSQLNLEGDSDAKLAERPCFTSECHYLENGRINKCTISGKCSVYEKHYHLDGLFPDCFVNLFDDKLSAGELYSYLMNPIAMCAYCGRWKLYNWEQAGNDPDMNDWIGAGKY